MKIENAPSNTRIITQVAAILDQLGPFQEGTLRQDKWRTTEQLAHEIFVNTGKRIDLDIMDRVLRQYEKDYQVRLKQGLDPEVLIRRAKYPDRTTVLPLWGSTKYHGQPWADLPAFEKFDPPEDYSEALKVPAEAPRVFVSHTHQDSALAFQLAEALAALGVGAWMYETEIGYGENITASVRKELASCAGCLAVVTRDSIASLWVLTELHSTIEVNKPVILVFNKHDDQLLALFRSVGLKTKSADFDFCVQYDHDIVCALKTDFIKRQSASRVGRYASQVHDFLVSLPMYLQGKPALVFPDLPEDHFGSIPINPLHTLPERLE